MRRIIPQSDSEMGNMLAKKRTVNLGWALNQGWTRAAWWKLTLSQMTTYWTCSGCPGSPSCWRMLSCSGFRNWRSCMDPVWHGGGGRHDCWWLCIWWCCLPSGQELVKKGCCVLFWAFLSGWTLPHQWRCTHVGQPWHPAQRSSTVVKKKYI